MMKRVFLTVAVIGLFGFLASDAMARHGHHRLHRHHGQHINRLHGQHINRTVHVGHGYQWHGNHVDRVDTYWHNGHYDTVRHHTRPRYRNSYYGGGVYGGYGGGYYGGYGVGYGYQRSGVSFYFGY